MFENESVYSFNKKINVINFNISCKVNVSVVGTVPVVDTYS